MRRVLSGVSRCTAQPHTSYVPVPHTGGPDIAQPQAGSSAAAGYAEARWIVEHEPDE